MRFCAYSGFPLYLLRALHSFTNAIRYNMVLIPFSSTFVVEMRWNVITAFYISRWLFFCFLYNHLTKRRFRNAEHNSGCSQGRKTGEDSSFHRFSNHYQWLWKIKYSAVHFFYISRTPYDIKSYLIYAVDTLTIDDFNSLINNDAVFSLFYHSSVCYWFCQVGRGMGLMYFRAAWTS